MKICITCSFVIKIIDLKLCHLHFEAQIVALRAPALYNKT